MNEHTLKVLEYDKVRSLVAGFAASEPGRAAVSKLLPALSPAVVAELLQETQEGTVLFMSGENLPLDGIMDIGASVDKLRISGMTLAPQELLEIAKTLGAGRRVKGFFERIGERGALARQGVPLLRARAAVIQPLPQMEDAVANAIDEKAEVKDSASPALRRVRKQISRMREDILGSLSGILQDGSLQKVVQEPVITMRDDRYVLPLRPNFRQSIRGVVHGQSGSRSTLFVEPLEVLEQNNRLAELRMEEREEVERILRELSGMLAQEVERIEAMTGALAAIDVIAARARFGIEYGAAVPVLSMQGDVRLRSARHPLLLWKAKTAGGADTIRPNDIVINREARVLILSGPNAGGKTAVLKTAGILCLMAQAGLPVTAGEGSELPCFGSFFADIGDEQSLEQNLSTFSSHVSQIAEILRLADEHSLVLLDELGSGTDPAEGAGLGAAVLESLIERGCVTMITTHQNALKLFGAETGGAVNAAMEFDPETLQPTYRLTPGRPGRSYGLDMAARLGIPDAVIKRARARLSEDDARLETLLRQVEQDAQRLDSERDILARDLALVRQQQGETEAVLQATKDEVREVRAKAHQEAREVLALMRQKLRELSNVRVPEQTAIKSVRSDIESLARTLEPEQVEQGRIPSGGIPDVHPGDQVSIPRLARSGTVLNVQHGVLEIEIDGKTLKISAEEVVPGERGRRPRKAAAPGWGSDLQDLEQAPDRLNLLGLRVDEALAEVDRYLDRVGLSGLTVVTIIHGLGTGALKTAMTGYLKHHPLVAATRAGEPAEGGAGVTVVELKK
jgi:DNA mismatch repair protein MutS2